MTDTDPLRLQPDHLPTPFSAEEIRQGCRPGRELRLRVEQPGEDPAIYVLRFIDGDAATGVQESWDETPSRERIGEPGQQIQPRKVCTDRLRHLVDAIQDQQTVTCGKLFTKHIGRQTARLGG